MNENIDPCPVVKSKMAFSCPVLKRVPLEHFTYLLADFGTAVLVDKKAIVAYGLVEGDHRYLAPELRDEHQGNDMAQLAKADIYSLGMVALQMMIRRLL